MLEPNVGFVKAGRSGLTHFTDNETMSALVVVGRRPSIGATEAASTSATAAPKTLRLRGSESQTLSIVGAFRVVPAGDRRNSQDRPLDPRMSDLRHLKGGGPWGKVSEAERRWAAGGAKPHGSG
jgi:hypothetical protein